MPLLDLQHPPSDPRGALLSQVMFAKNAPPGGFREEMLRRARENAVKAGLSPSVVDVVYRNATGLAVDPRLSSQSTTKKATIDRIRGHADQLSHLHRIAALAGNDSELYNVASLLHGVSAEEAIAGARNIIEALGGKGPNFPYASAAHAFFSDPAKVQAELARRVAFEQKRFKQAHRSSPFSIVAPIAGGLFGAAIPGIAGGIIGGAIGGSANGLEGVLKGALLGGLAKFAAPKVSNLLGSFKAPAVNPNAVPGISTGVTTPAGGGAIVGTGQAATLQGIGGVPTAGAVNALGSGITGFAPLGASPLAVSGGAIPSALFPRFPGLGTVQGLPPGQIPGTNINVGGGKTALEQARERLLGVAKDQLKGLVKNQLFGGRQGQKQNTILGTGGFGGGLSMVAQNGNQILTSQNQPDIFGSSTALAGSRDNFLAIRNPTLLARRLQARYPGWVRQYMS